MRSDAEVTGFVQSWLREPEDVLPDRVLDDVLELLPSTRQRRPLWRAGRRALAGSFRFAVTGVAVLALAFMGYAIFRANLGPVATPTPLPTASPSPTPSVSPVIDTSQLVAYTALQGNCVTTPTVTCERRIWIATADGSGAHELLPGAAGDQQVIGWSPDGSRLLYAILHEDEPADLFATDAAGSEPELLCAADAGVCPYASGAFSPDGTKLAYALNDLGTDGTSVIAVLELSTGQVTELESTRAPIAVAECETADKSGRAGTPAWSPDGTQLVFSRGFAGALPDSNCREAVMFAVSADGSGMRQITSAVMWATEGRWSPDGTRIVFGGDERRPSALLWATDLYTMQADGRDMRRLTTDGGAGSWHWTGDGRIVYAHNLPGGTFDEFRLTSWDGTGETTLRYDRLSDLTLAGCAICPYGAALSPAYESPPVGLAFWQPRP